MFINVQQTMYASLACVLGSGPERHKQFSSDVKVFVGRNCPVLGRARYMQVTSASGRIKVTAETSQAQRRQSVKGRQ